jgi:phosphohistidine phosphatase SixA
MILILFRHGHKSLTPFEDPDLTQRGFDQAENLVAQIESGILPTPTHCWFSEKIRTRQTLSKAIEKYHPVTKIQPDLNVRSHSESHKEFKHRIQKFLLNISAVCKATDVHFVCTHYDWIDDGLTLINTDKGLNSFEFSSWQPGQYLAFEIESTDHNDAWKVLKKGVLT